MNRYISVISQISVRTQSWTLVSTRYTTLLVPTRHHPGYTPPRTTATGVMTEHVRTAEQYGRGAQIRRATHFEGTLVAVPGYDRGL